MESYLRICGFLAQSYFLRSSSYSSNLRFSSLVGVCRIWSVASENVSVTMSWPLAKRRSSVKRHPSGIIALASASINRKIRGCCSSETPWANAGGVSRLPRFQFAPNSRSSWRFLLFHSAIRFRCATISGRIRACSWGSRICAATFSTTCRSSSGKKARGAEFSLGGSTWLPPVCIPSFVCSFPGGRGSFLTGFPARNFAQYPCGGVGMSSDLHTLWMVTSETLYRFATSVTGMDQTS